MSPEESIRSDVGTEPKEYEPPSVFTIGAVQDLTQGAHEDHPFPPHPFPIHVSAG